MGAKGPAAGPSRPPTHVAHPVPRIEACWLVPNETSLLTARGILIYLHRSSRSTLGTNYVGHEGLFGFSLISSFEIFHHHEFRPISRHVNRVVAEDASRPERSHCQGALLPLSMQASGLREYYLGRGMLLLGPRGSRGRWSSISRTRLVSRRLFVHDDGSLLATFM